MFYLYLYLVCSLHRYPDCGTKNGAGVTCVVRETYQLQDGANEWEGFVYMNEEPICGSSTTPDTIANTICNKVFAEQFKGEFVS